MLTYTDSLGDTLNMGDYVRQHAEHDVVVVNFPTYVNMYGDTIDGGADYIERNALALVSVIEEINSLDRKSTRLNSSHVRISYAVFCLKKKKKKNKNMNRKMR